MEQIQVVLDKRIPFNITQVYDGENVIFCKSFKDELFNTGSFSTKDKDFVHKYIIEDNKKYIITDVSTPDGRTYKNVKFQIVLNEREEIPLSTFNPRGEKSIADPFKLAEKKQLLVETKRFETKPVVALDVTENINRIKQDKEYILKAKQLEHSLIEEKTRLVKERKELEEQKQIVKNERVVEEKLNDHKQRLLQEFLNVSEKQENIIEEKFNTNLKNFETQLNVQKQIHDKDIKIVLEDLNRKNLERLEKNLEKALQNKQGAIDEKIEGYNDSIQNVFIEQTNEIKNQFNEKVKNIENDNVEKLKSFLEKRIDEQKNELISLLENKGENFVSKIVDKSDELKKLFDEKFVADLQQYKEKLIEEINHTNESIVKEYLEKKKIDVGEDINKFILNERSFLEKDFNKNVADLRELLEKTANELNERTPSLDQKIKLIQDKLDQLPKDKQLLVEVKQDILTLSQKYTDSQVKRVAEDSMTYARRILDLGGGGGSVAVQYANGGVMNGDLNVSNIYPNNATGSIGSPSNRWDKIYANQVDSLSSNIVIELSGFYVDGDFTVNGTISAIGGNSNQWNSTYTTVNSNSANYILDGGNTKGANISIGTNDAYNLSLETNALARLLITSDTLSGNTSKTSFGAGSATGLYSFAEGSGTLASGNYSHAEGFNTIASGLMSHAEGNITTATNNYSHAEGENSDATGYASHAQGDTAKASGGRSHAEGYHTVASGAVSHAAGRFIEAAHDHTWAWKGSTSNFTISTTRSQQFMVSASGGMFIPGNVGIGTDDNSNSLTVVGTISTNAHGTSNQWNSTYTSLNANSGKYESTYTTVNAMSANNASVYTSLNANSGKYESVYTTTNTNSGSWANTYILTATNFSVTDTSNWAVDTFSAAIQCTLPASPQNGTTINFLDTKKTWATKNLVLLRNSQLIESLTENLSCNINGYSFSLIYVGGSIGWRIAQTLY